MQCSNDFILLSLEGKNEYKCIISPELVIISVDPPNDFLLHKDLNEIYNFYKDQIKIRDLKIVGVPYLVGEDIFKKFSSKNKSIIYLHRKFECDFL